MQDDRSPWLDDGDVDAEGPGGRRRLRFLAAVATLPWLVVGAVVLVPAWRGGPASPHDPAHGGHVGHTDQAAVPDPPGGPAPPPGGWEQPQTPGDGHGGPPPGPDGPTPPDDELAPAAPDAPAPYPDDLLDPGGVLGLTELRGDWRIGPESGDLAAVAAIVARAWLTGVEPVLSVGDLDPLEGHYVEHLVVEAVERPSTDTAVATLAAVVLEDGGEGFVARVRRLAVPLVVGPAGGRPAGPPWFLPAPDLRPAALPTVPVDDPAVLLAAAEAVTAAGYLDAELHALERTDHGPWVARISARTPDGVAVDGPVWLRRHLDGFVVAGTPLSPGQVGDGPEVGR